MTATVVPPFTRGTAIAKIRMAGNGWNSRNPDKVSLTYPIGTREAERRASRRTPGQDVES